MRRGFVAQYQNAVKEAKEKGCTLEELLAEYTKKLSIKKSPENNKTVGELLAELDAPKDSEDDLYAMSNVYPEDSGLPMTVWVRPRSNERHGPRIKVCTVHGNRMLPDETVSVALSPIRIIAGKSDALSIDDLRLVTQWLDLNREAVTAHWEGRISSGQFFRQMQKIPD